MDTGNVLYYNPAKYGVDKLFRDYYVSLIRQILEDKSLSLNVICDDEAHVFNNTNKTIRIDFNSEHILVAQGGRSAVGAPLGSIKDAKGDPYLVRIDKYDILNRADIIIDYSLPNIHHVNTSGLYNEFATKMIYIAPCIYPCSFEGPRSIDVLTTFINPEQPRRIELIQRMQEYVAHQNRNDCFEKELLHTLFKDTKILVNIHQTEHHHTFEELRVLSALECGVIVVAEESPLHHLVPYNDYVIWEQYHGILGKVIEILENYEEYHASIFKEPKKVTLESLHDDNFHRLRSKLLEFAPSNK